MLNELRRNHRLVEALWSAVNTSSGSIVNVAPLILRLLETGAWKRREVPELGSTPVEFASFAEFIETDPLKGCGWPLNKIEALIKDNEVALEKYRTATSAPVGRPSKENSNIVTIKHKRGNALAYTLDRLKRERPDLFDRVVAKELTANAAAIQAGFRRKLSRKDQILLWLPKLSQADRDEIHAALEELSHYSL